MGYNSGSLRTSGLGLLCFGIFISITSCFLVKQASYPELAHSHFVWLSRERSNDSNIREFVQGFLDRDIPVGGIDVDSGWSTGFNNFIVDETKFPNMKEFIKDMNALGIQVIFWTTSFVNEDSSNYKEGKEKNYYLSDGALIKWWHGKGALLDYSNEDAVEWWHDQLDNILDLGAAGFKCDGSDPFTLELVVPVGRGGDILPREYSERYYRDFYYYSRKKHSDGLIMSRPVDSFDAIAFGEFAPRDVVVFGWVGDQDPTWKGLKDCMQNVLHSAWNGYVSFGCDIGGYRSGDESRTAELFLRWSQYGAFLPVMENGGNGFHNPWHYDSQELNASQIYSKFAHAHEELSSYLVTAGSVAFEQGTSILKPSEIETGFTPNDWSYLLGPDIYVQPIVEPSIEKLEVSFPNGSDWMDYWSGKEYKGGSKVFYECSIDNFPVFQRKGSIIPLRVRRGSTTGHSVYSLELMVFKMSGLPERSQKGRMEVREWKGNGIEMFYRFIDIPNSENHLSFEISKHEKDMALLVKNFPSDSTSIRIIVNGEDIPMIHDSILASNRKIKSWLMRGRELHVLLPTDEEGLNFHLYSTVDVFYQ